MNPISWKFEREDRRKWRILRFEKWAPLFFLSIKTWRFEIPPNNIKESLVCLLKLHVFVLTRNSIGFANLLKVVPHPPRLKPSKSSLFPDYRIIFHHTLTFLVWIYRYVQDQYILLRRRFNSFAISRF